MAMTKKTITTKKPVQPHSGRFRIALFGVAILVTTLQGCSTVAVHAEAGVVPPPYAGTKRAVKETQRAWTHYRYYGEVMFVVWDIPFSAVADTVVLPVDLSRQAARDQASGAAAERDASGY